MTLMHHPILRCYHGILEGHQALRGGAECAPRVAAVTRPLTVTRWSPGAAARSALADPLGTPRQGLEELFRKGVDRLRTIGSTATGPLAFGDPVPKILAYARSIPAYLIAVGHRHCSSLARWWSRSVDVGLLEQAPCSILVALQEPLDG